MSLATRLSLFFLAALAVVLLGFSSTLYYLGRSHLNAQLDERLERGLDTLTAAVEIDDDELGWKPADRHITLGVDAGVEQIRWFVQDDRGRIIDRSANSLDDDAPIRVDPSLFPPVPNDQTAVAEIPGWHLARRHLRLEDLLRLGKWEIGEIEDAPDDDDYLELIFTVALSPAPVHASLGRLALALAAVSLGLLLISAVLGRRLCRRALAPIASLAKSARRKAATDDQGGLPTPRTGDELEELGRAFNALLDRRREALERQQRFAGDASHQLRTPLAGLLSLVEVTRRRPRSSPEYEHALDQVHREARRLNQIIESLLFLVRAEAEAAPLEREPIDLAVWTPEILGRWLRHPRADDLRYEGPDHGVWTSAHPPLLAQALENLVDNALKYSEPGSPVVVSVQNESAAATLTVSDQGRGMTAEELGSVFEPFYRSPQARLRGSPGAGLGLSVAERVVHASGGSIQVASVPNLGSQFTVRLPATPQRVVESVDAEPATIAR